MQSQGLFNQAHQASLPRCLSELGRGGSRGCSNDGALGTPAVDPFAAPTAGVSRSARTPEGALQGRPARPSRLQHPSAEEPEEGCAVEEPAAAGPKGQEARAALQGAGPGVVVVVMVLMCVWGVGWGWGWGRRAKAASPRGETATLRMQGGSGREGIRRGIQWQRKPGAAACEQVLTCSSTCVSTAALPSAAGCSTARIGAVRNGDPPVGSGGYEHGLWPSPARCGPAPRTRTARRTLAEAPQHLPASSILLAAATAAAVVRQQHSSSSTGLCACTAGP